MSTSSTTRERPIRKTRLRTGVRLDIRVRPVGLITTSSLRCVRCGWHVQVNHNGRLVGVSETQSRIVLLSRGRVHRLRGGARRPGPDLR